MSTLGSYLEFSCYLLIDAYCTHKTYTYDELPNSSLIGYKFNDDKLEEQEQYLKRLAGLQRLYSAVLITKLKRDQQHIEHPHGLDNGWIWFTNFLMLDPLPGISSTLLLEFIQTCGLDMWQVYKKQFMKLLILLHYHYLAKLEQVSLFYGSE